jgi:hypothetical protein
LQSILQGGMLVSEINVLLLQHPERLLQRLQTVL